MRLHLDHQALDTTTLGAIPRDGELQSVDRDSQPEPVYSAFYDSLSWSPVQLRAAAGAVGDAAASQMRVLASLAREGRPSWASEHWDLLTRVRDDAIEMIAVDLARQAASYAVRALALEDVEVQSFGHVRR